MKRYDMTDISVTGVPWREMVETDEGSWVYFEEANEILNDVLDVARKEIERSPIARFEQLQNALVEIDKEFGVHSGWASMIMHIASVVQQLAALRSRADDAGRVDEGAPRKALAWFTRRMERKLKANDHKDHWTTCETQWLFSRVLEEAQELLSAMPDEPWELSEEEKDRIIDEAADVANFALMIADIARQAMPKTRAVLAAADREGE